MIIDVAYSTSILHVGQFLKIVLFIIMLCFGLRVKHRMLKLQARVEIINEVRGIAVSCTAYIQDVHVLSTVGDTVNHCSLES